MRRILLALPLLAAVPAFAQQPQMTPEIRACWDSVTDETAGKIDWRAKAYALQAQGVDLTKQLADTKKQVDDLTKQLADAKKPAAETKDSK